MTRGLSQITLFWYGLGGGGAERSMLTLAEEFLDQGVQTDIVLSTAQGRRTDEVPSGARVFNLKSERLVASLPGLIRYLRQHEPPVLLSSQKTANCIALLARALSGVPTRVVITVRNTLSSLVNLSDWRDQVVVYLMRFLYPFADGTIAVSRGVADDLSHFIGLDRQDIDVIYNPVVRPWLEDKQKEPIEHPWFFDESCPVILGVGRLVEQKDFSSLLEAFARVRQNRRVRLVILGEGEKRSTLKQLAGHLGIEEELWMPGYSTNPLKYMSRASVFVLSSKWEGLGNVLIEAMACGTPVVSTDCPSGPAEILKGGKYGKLVPVEDVSALAAGMEEALDGNVEPAPRSALDRFRRDRVAEKYLDTLGRVS